MRKARQAARDAVLALGFIALAASGASARTYAATDDQPATGVKPGESKAKRVCRSVEITGSRLRERICRSQAEWEHDSEQAFRLVRDGQEHGYRKDGERNGEGQVVAPR